MKKILMVVTFLLMVAMVPAAHATLYTLKADKIWFNTGIVLNGESITISGGQTHTSWSDIPVKSQNSITNIEGGWKTANENMWTWGIGWYAGLTPGIPRVWTDANGGSGHYIVGDSIYEVYGQGWPTGLDDDEWLTTAAHGMLIGYIGDLNPLLQGGEKDENEEYKIAGQYRLPNLYFQDNTNLFGIGTATVTQFGTGTLWIGMNDDFVDYIYGVEDNFGYATVNVNVPEPASMLLLFFGLMGVLGLRRKFRS